MPGPSEGLNGRWNAARLDDLAQDVEAIKKTLQDAPRLKDMANDVAAIKKTLGDMQDDEVQSLRQRVKEAENRPRRVLLILGAPVVGVIATVVVQHVH